MVWNSYPLKNCIIFWSINILHAKMTSWSHYKVLPLRMPCTVTAFHPITNKNENEIFQTEIFFYQVSYPD